MRAKFGSRRRKNAQTLVFFLLAWGMIMVLAGLAIDSGLLYLAKAKMGRAVDGAALAAVGNFNRDPDPATNRDDVAKIMRNFATANFTDLGLVGESGGPGGGTPNTTTLPNGTQSTSYTYNFNDGTQDPNGQFKRFIQVTLNTGSNGAITSATCNARCPVQTYFIGYATYAINGQQNGKIGGYSGYKDGQFDLKVSSSAVASRHPRLIMVVIDRSASMLTYDPSNGIIGGASGLAPAIVQFLDFFDTSSDSIGIVSFGSSARLEVPMTTNFIVAGTNNLSDTYNSTNDIFTPGVDPETDPADANYDPNYNTTGVRRMKFGGNTAADDGIRLAMEQLMANPGFTDPDVVKYMVIFTDGKWNASRTLVAAPGYTNRIDVPSVLSVPATNFVSNTFANTFSTNGQQYTVTTNAGVVTTNYGPWVATVSDPNSMVANANILPVPTLSPLPGVTNAIAAPNTYQFGDLVAAHANDVWLSADGNNEPPRAPMSLEGGVGNLQGSTVTPSQLITNNAWVGSNPTNSSINYYTHQFDVWLQPGSVAYLYHRNFFGQLAVSNSGAAVYVSDYTNPTKHIFLNVASGDRVDLVVPGYIADSVIYDGLDLDFPDNADYFESGYPRFRNDNFQIQLMWPDDTGTENYDGNYTSSLERQLLFRNYANLLTGFYAFRADEPNGPGVEPLIKEYSTNNPPGAPRPRYGLGAYYPSAGFYWPFGGEQTNAAGYVTNAVGLDSNSTFGLQDPTVDSQARHIAYSINMLSSNAAPEWYGELFYKGSGTTNTISTTTAVSQIMQSADWQAGLPTFASAFSGVMTAEATHNTNIVGSPSVWRPLTFNGSNNLVTAGLGGVSPGDGANATGGYVTDGNGNYYRNTMAWSGRPTHYFNFAQGTWIPIADNHMTNSQFLQLGNWKASEYAWHARALGVTIYTVGYGTLVTPTQCAFLAQLANATNSISPGSPLVTNSISFNPSQPIGQQFYATTPTDISNDFFQVGQAINAALTQ